VTGERVLIVDDEEGIRRLLVSLCRREGYETLVAADGASAFALLEKTPIDVSIIDLFLPDVHGLEVLRRIKERYPSSEVIILTGHADFETAVEAMRLGAYDYLQKPIPDLQLIPLTISRALERQNLLRRNERLVQELQETNLELERRQRQQLEYIHDIGQALTGALNSFDVAQVLARAILGSITCDGVGVLLLSLNGAQRGLALVGAPKMLSASAKESLVQAMIDYVPEPSRPDATEIQVHVLDPGSQEVDDAPWRRFEFAPLAMRGSISGVAALASHSEEPFAQDERDIFAILASQGSIALENAYLFARMRELATKDGLTGLYNHAHFFELFEAEINRAERYAHELAIIMLDIDGERGLKFVNDTYGHQAGDELLRQLATLLRRSVRKEDIVARYGGDEFIILAPQTGKQQALALAERIRQVISETPFAVSDDHVYITVSGGVAVYHPGAGETASSVVSLADRGLYLAKRKGGNSVCTAD